MGLFSSIGGGIVGGAIGSLIGGKKRSGGSGRQTAQAQAPRADPPTGGAYEGFSPTDTFGGNPEWTQENPFFARGQGENRSGAGLYNLPPAFAGWNATSRYSFAPTLDYVNQTKDAIGQLKSDSEKDYQAELFGMSSDALEGQFSDAKRKREQSYAQAGYGGGGTVSPFAAQQMQLEGAARAGQLGNAARQSVIQAQSMRQEASRSYLNAVQSQLQAMLVPAQLQLAGGTKQPLAGPIGPTSLVGPALNLGAAALTAYGS